MVSTMTDLKNTVLSDLLCYFSSARNSLSQEELITNAMAFYKLELVLKAKETICKLAKEKNIARKSCQDHPDPIAAHLKDIFDCFEKMERNNIQCPKFVAEGIHSFPPAGFQFLAPMMCALRDEIAALRHEVSEVRQANQNDERALNSATIVAQDVTEIKTLVQRVLHGTSHQSPPRGETSSLTETAGSGASMTQTETGGVTASAGDDVQAEGNNWRIANNRPYAYALRRNGLPANPARRTSNLQGNRNVPSQMNNHQSARRRREVIVGRRTSSSDIANSDQIYDLFLGGCKTSSTVEAIQDYCIRNDVTLKKCEVLNSRNEWSKCYKLSATQEDRNKLLDGDFWPCGIYVRKFYRRGMQNEA